MTASTRLTQPERVEAMRGRLLDATIDSLASSGYHAFSTNDVVRRAGVSRGALAHHFPSKGELVAAAADRLIGERAAEFRERFAAVPPRRRTVGKALDVLWTFFDDRGFHALLELIVAARTDAELRPVVAAGMQHASEVTRQVFAESFPALARQPFIGEVLDGILALYVGLAAESTLDQAAVSRAAAVRSVLRGVLSLGATTSPSLA
jgi:AcrR family transcriptional regulator